MILAPTDPVSDEASVERLKIGISRCLMGERVRYDGGHKRSKFLVGNLSKFVDWFPVCPEVESGMSVPREPIRLVEVGHEVRLLGLDSGEDHTAGMMSFSQRKLEELREIGISGFIAKSKSPSCGLYRVEVHGTGQPSNSAGRGLFTDQLLSRYPSLPVEEESRIADPDTRDNWIERVFAYRALKFLFERPWTQGQLVAFHSCYKLTLMAHSNARYRLLGNLVGTAVTLDRTEFKDRYIHEFMEAMACRVTTSKHVNVLQHILGYLENKADRNTRQEIHRMILEYQDGIIPLAIPLQSLSHQVRIHAVSYLEQQQYLNPHPWERLLRYPTGCSHERDSSSRS